MEGRGRSEYVRLNITQLHPYRASGERLTGKKSIANYNIIVNCRYPNNVKKLDIVPIVYTFLVGSKVSRVTRVSVC